jgi:hypothetical protein
VSPTTASQFPRSGPGVGALAETADALAVSTRTVRRYFADDQLDAERLGRKTLRIKVDSIERFIDAGRHLAAGGARVARRTQKQDGSGETWPLLVHRNDFGSKKPPLMR